MIESKEGTCTRKDLVIKKDYEKDKKSIQDIKKRYINTSNLEKIEDLLEKWIETR